MLRFTNRSRMKSINSIGWGRRSGKSQFGVSNYLSYLAQITQIRIGGDSQGRGGCKDKAVSDA